MRKLYFFITVLIILAGFISVSQAQAPQYYNSNTGASGNSFPFNVAGGKAVNSLILAGEFSQPTPLPAGQKITTVYFRTSGAGTRTYTNLRILMAQDVITTLTSATFYAGPYDTVYFNASPTFTTTVGGWMNITLDHGFNYDVTKSLILFVEQCGATGAGGSVYNSTGTDIRRTWSVGGCPTVPYAGGDASIVNFGVDVVPQTPQYFNSNTGTSGNSFPFNVAGGKAVNTLILSGEFSQPTPLPSGQKITKVYFRTSGAGTRTYTNLRILMAQSVLTTLTSATFYAGPYDTVYFNASPTFTTTVGGWMSMTLDHAFNYDVTKSLILFVEQCGATGSGGSVYNSSLTDIRRTWSVGGCPTVPYAGGDASCVNFGVDVVPSGATAITNRTLKLATPGINTTYVSVPYNAGMVGFGNNITIEAWIKPGGTTTAATVLNKGVASFDYQLGVSLSTMIPFFRAGSTIATCPFPIQAGIWQHLAVVSNGSTVTFYLNGVAGAPVTAACVLGSSANEMRIGRGNSDAGSGLLDEIRLWSVARTAGEIYSGMCNKWIPNNAPGLKAKWHFDSTYVDSVSGWNGVPMGTAGFDTLTFCPIVTNISGNGVIVPKSYKLNQNYPNPFNPTTKISFSIPKSGLTTLKVYDMLGKEIATLVNETKTAGEYIVEFNASSFATGVYFYRLEINGFTDTKKLVLIK